MDNVYRQVTVFYRENPDLKELLPQDLIEKYLRKCAWNGMADAELRRIWDAVAVVLLYIKQLQLFSLDSLTVHDYQEALYMAQDAHKEWFLSEPKVTSFFQVLDAFVHVLILLLH